jgi:hypothetical protein
MSSCMSTAGGMEDNGTAFTHLLWLVSRGQALIAELLRLTANVPPVFNPELEPKYADILIDFRYFKVRRNGAPQLRALAAGGMRLCEDMLQWARVRQHPFITAAWL